MAHELASPRISSLERFGVRSIVLESRTATSSYHSFFASRSSFSPPRRSTSVAFSSIHSCDRSKGGKLDEDSAIIAPSWSSAEEFDLADCSLVPRLIDSLDIFLLGAALAAEDDEASFLLRDVGGAATEIRPPYRTRSLALSEMQLMMPLIVASLAVRVLSSGVESCWASRAATARI